MEYLKGEVYVRLSRGSPRRGAATRPAGPLCLLLLFAVSGLTGAEPRDYTRNLGGGLNFFSVREERKLGQRYSNELNRKLDLLGRLPAQSYIERLGMRVFEASAQPRRDYRFFLVNTREVNAFAVPGGFIYVTRGLVDLAENEAQLAGVLGHEIAHVEARHGTKQVSKQLLLLGTVAAASAAVSQKSEKWGSVIAASGGIGVLLANLKYSRNDEYQADALAARWMAAAGYDPRELIAFFRKMDSSRSPGALGRALALLSTHPPTPDRVRSLTLQLETIDWRPDLANSAPDEFRDCKLQLASLPPPPKKEITLSNALAALGLSENVAVEGSLPSIGTREQAQRVLEIKGNTVWMDSGVTVRQGQLVEVWAEGEISLTKQGDLHCDPSGVYGRTGGFFKPLSNVYTGALIGRIQAAGDSKPFPIGTHRVFRAPASGKLELGINDDNNFDNRGAFQVWILTR